MGKKLYSKEELRQIEDMIRKVGYYDDYRKLLDEIANVEKLNSHINLKEKAVEVTESAIKLFGRIFELEITDVEVEFVCSKEDVIDVKILTSPIKLSELDLDKISLDIRCFVADLYLKMLPFPTRADIVIVNDDNEVSNIELANDLKQSSQEPYNKLTLSCMGIYRSRLVIDLECKWL